MQILVYQHAFKADFLHFSSVESQIRWKVHLRRLAMVRGGGALWTVGTGGVWTDMWPALLLNSPVASCLSSTTESHNAAVTDNRERYCRWINAWHRPFSSLPFFHSFAMAHLTHKRLGFGHWKGDLGGKSFFFVNDQIFLFFLSAIGKWIWRCLSVWHGFRFYLLTVEFGHDMPFFFFSPKSRLCF